jgi:hypothetical protein
LAAAFGKSGPAKLAHNSGPPDDSNARIVTPAVTKNEILE